MAASRPFSALFAAFLLAAGAFACPAQAAPATPTAPAAAPRSDAYTSQEIVDAGHHFFGEVSGGLATLVEKAVSAYGLPNGYIIGQEGSGAIVGGVRYGDGFLYTKVEGRRQVYWQGPSIGWDFGGDGNRTMMLVYDLPNSLAIYRRYAGVNGSAYLVGGLGMTVLVNNGIPNNTVTLVPIRSGVGARLGVNVGYLKFTDRPTWNPF
jgi:hypothetical protein